MPTTNGSTLSPTASIALLYRRAGFGASPAQLAAGVAQGYGATVDALLSGVGAPDPAADAVPVPTLLAPPPDLRKLKADPAAAKAFERTLRDERRALVAWWLARMVATTQPLGEKLTFLLHCQFPTAVSKVRFPRYMYGQNQLFRTLGGGDFTALTQAVSTDPAMLIWLDAAMDKAADPNENFARELMERFTMGIGTYTEADVRAASYCFTGWKVAPGGTFTVDARTHSTSPQTVLGTPGLTTGQQVIDLVTRSDASARFVPARLWSHLAYPVAPDDPVVHDLSVGYAGDRNVGALLRAIFGHPQFTTTTTAAGLVKQPTEYVVGALRALGITGADVLAGRPPLGTTMADMGQVLFDPPSVGGWAQNEYWLSTSAALARWRFAQELCRSADLSPVADAAPGSRVDAAAELLSIPTWSSATATALARAAGDPATLMTLALNAPEYVTN